VVAIFLVLARTSWPWQARPSSPRPPWRRLQRPLPWRELPRLPSPLRPRAAGAAGSEAAGLGSAAAGFGSAASADAEGLAVWDAVVATVKNGKKSVGWDVPSRPVGQAEGGGKASAGGGGGGGVEGVRVGDSSSSGWDQGSLSELPFSRTERQSLAGNKSREKAGVRENSKG